MNTHNLLQGQRLSDRVAVMIDGTVEQSGPPREVFQAPMSRAIATFVGIDNILRGRVRPGGEDLTEVEVEGQTLQSKTPPPGTDDVEVLIRGEDIDLVRDAEADPRKNRFACTVATIESVGPYVRMDVDCGGFPLVVRMTARTAAEREFDTGTEAWAVFRPRAVHLLPADVLR
jgi:tungstate transport system ATP-binding protein